MRNDVELVFGNRQRKGAFRGPRVDAVPGVGGNGACGMDGGGPGAKDEFRAGIVGNARHRIVDLGKIDFRGLKTIPQQAEAVLKNDRASYAEVRLDHVYVIRLHDPNDKRYLKPIHVKLKVLRHRDNDAILIEWKPL